MTDDLKDQKLQLMVGEISQIADNMGADLQNEEMQPLVAQIPWTHNIIMTKRFINQNCIFSYLHAFVIQKKGSEHGNK